MDKSPIFFAGNIDTTVDTAVGQQVDQNALSMPDGEMKPEDIKKILDKQNKLIRRIANIRLVGVRTLYSWTGNHPDSETPIVGIVRIWSAANEKAIQARQSPAAHAPARTRLRAQSTRCPEIVQGRQLMKSSDF